MRLRRQLLGLTVMNHFEIFGLAPALDLDVKALEQKLRDLSLEFHPDRVTQGDARTRLAALESRLRSAVLVDSAAHPREEVRFGASVTVRSAAGAVRTYEIVGVDEARTGEGRGVHKIAFIAPLARALLGRRAGDVATVKTPRGEDDLEILSIDYSS